MAEIVYDIKKTYAELDSWIAGLTPGTYNVEVDCTGVDADQFKGKITLDPETLEPTEIVPSNFAIKLQKAQKDVFFNLKPINIAENVNDATAMFCLNTNIKSIDTKAFTNVINASYMFSACSALTSIDTKAFTKVTNASNMFNSCKGLTSIDTKAFTNVINASYMFSACSALTSIDTKAFTNVINASYMFHYCEKLTSIDTKAFTNVINASYMFSICTELTSITGTEAFTQVTNTESMFYSCLKLTSIDTSAFTNVIDASYMFHYCEKLTNINWGNIKPTTSTGMFESASAQKIIKVIGQSTADWIEINKTNMNLINYTIEKIPFTGKLKYSELDVWIPEFEPGTYDLEVDCTGVTADQFKGDKINHASSLFCKTLSKTKSDVFFNLKFGFPDDVEDATSCFDNYSHEGVSTKVLKSVDVISAKNLTNADSMFFYNEELTNVNTDNMSKITNADSMFRACPKLNNISTTPFTNVTSARNMFDNCRSFTSIDVSPFKNVEDAFWMFYYCENLTNITGEESLEKVIDAEGMFQGCSKLKKINTRNFTKVENSRSMFEDCSSLEEIDTNAFTNTNNAMYMFKNCKKINTIDISVFDKVLRSEKAFEGCENTSILYATNSNIFDKGADLINSPIKTVYTNAATKEKIKSKLPNSGVVYYDLKEKIIYSSTDGNVNYNDKCILGDLKVGGNIEGNLTGNLTGNVNGDIGQFNTVNVNGKNVVDAIKNIEGKINIYGGFMGMYNPIISVPSFTFNSVVCKNVNFVFMGIAESKGNEGKAIYMSADCLPGVKVSMDALLAGGTDVGTGTIGKAAETSLDAEIFKITGKHLEIYTREYDSVIHNERVFLPLECEVHGLTTYSADKSTLSKYSQWEGFKKSPDSKIKYIDFSSNKYETWFWWNATKSSNSGNFCLVGNYGLPDDYRSYRDSNGVALAFCL